jgi:Spy/CpxP family protein refolding chaperone
VRGDTGSGRRRRALVRFRAADPLPDLPVLSEMWMTEVDPHDAGQVQDALDRLRTAEQQLTTYRRALHDRIDEATRELILRYKDDPLAALSVIPQE